MMAHRHRSSVKRANGNQGGRWLTNLRYLADLYPHALLELTSRFPRSGSEEQDPLKTSIP